MRPTRSAQLIPKAHFVFSLVVAGLLLTGAAYSGEVYKWTDGAGKVHFGDKPFGRIQATRVDIPTSPDAQTAAPQSVVTTHDGGYSDTLNTCLSAGGTKTECVAQASAAQTNKAATERNIRENVERNRAQNASYQANYLAPQPTNSDAETAHRAAALAAERARQQREQRDREWR